MSLSKTESPILPISDLSRFFYTTTPTQRAMSAGHKAFLGPSRIGCPPKVQFQQLGEDLFVGHFGVPAVGGEDGLVEFLVGQI